MAIPSSDGAFYCAHSSTRITVVAFDCTDRANVAVIPQGRRQTLQDQTTSRSRAEASRVSAHLRRAATEERSMQKYCLTLSVFAAAMAVSLSAAPAHAQATGTWVSGVGDDANPCSRTAPCKTFAG